MLITNNANSIIDISNFLITTISGSEFPVIVLPSFILAISLALPLTYGFVAIIGITLRDAILKKSREILQNNRQYWFSLEKAEVFPSAFSYIDY